MTRGTLLLFITLGNGETSSSNPRAREEEADGSTHDMDRRWILYALAFVVTSSVSGVGKSSHINSHNLGPIGGHFSVSCVKSSLSRRQLITSHTLTSRPFPPPYSLRLACTPKGPSG